VGARQEKYSETNPVVRLLLGRFFARLRLAVNAAGATTVLDAGCGEGELLRRGVLPAAVTPVCLDVCEESLLEVPRDARRVRGSVFRMPFDDAAFDLVLCLEVLEHLEDPAAALAELRRVARRAVVVSVPYEPWFQLGNLARGKYRRQWGNHPEHIHHWTPNTFRRFLGEGFAAVEVASSFPWIIANCRV
jgi:ubiquinone/menaquinone biosynthesis C-methylase UbiE